MKSILTRFLTPVIINGISFTIGDKICVGSWESEIIEIIGDQVTYRLPGQTIKIKSSLSDNWSTSITKR